MTSPSMRAVCCAPHHVVDGEVVSHVVSLFGRAEERHQLGLARPAGLPCQGPVGGRRRAEVHAPDVDQTGRVRQVVVPEHEHRVPPGRRQVECQLDELHCLATSTGASTMWR